MYSLVNLSMALTMQTDNAAKFELENFGDEQNI